MLVPYTRDHRMRHPQLRTQFACAPMSRTVARRFADRFQNTGRKTWGRCLRRLGAMATVQTRESLCLEAFRPARDVGVIARSRFTDRCPGSSVGQHQNTSRPSSIICRPLWERIHFCNSLRSAFDNSMAITQCLIVVMAILPFQLLQITSV